MSAENELTQAEFMTACLADGNSKDVCEARWKAAHTTNEGVTTPPASPGDADLLNKIAMLEAKLKVREDQLKQAIEIAGRANDEKKATEKAEKESIIGSILIDSKGYTTDELQGKTLPALREIRMAIDKTSAPKFAAVIASMDAEKHKMRPQLTAGYYDAATKTWKGGI